MPIVNRDYYGAGQRGRQDALDNRFAQTRNALGAIGLEEARRVNALAQDPNATAEQYARAGRSDIGDTLLNYQSHGQKLEQQKAERLFLAAQYALASDRPKELIATQFPEIAALNPTFAQETDEQIRASMQQLLAKFGSQAGVGPAAPAEFTLAPGAARYRGNQIIAERPNNTDEQGFTLSPGQTRFGPDGRPIASAPDRPTKDQAFDMAAKLRSEFNAQAKEFRGIADSYQRIVDSASDPSAAGDLALIFNYMKVLDPGSTVREGEFATAQNSAGIPGRIVSLYNSVINGQRLNADQRKDFVDRATKLYKGQESRFTNNTVKRYESLSRMYGIDPSNVIVNMNAAVGGSDQPQPAQASIRVSTPEEAMALPSGTVFMTPDGRTKVRP